ncbi:subtilisin-like protein [Lojkania enalia]|uniref:Subtilisin-like protein n=1 Tax=Lojkania enalia TaxID=147567 RepID=A0A9P4K3Z2_9PLEO|nr:subtilisin-like protein [Didymosphaeria enalia]
MKLSHLFLLLLPIAAPSTVLSKWIVPQGDDIIPGRWIVQLKPGITADIIAEHHAAVKRIFGRNKMQEAPGRIGKLWQFGNFTAYAASFDESSAADIAELPDVYHVEPDRIIRAMPITKSAEPKPHRSKRFMIWEHDIQWNLGHISHREPGSDIFVYDSSAGKGMYAYILDTGIRLTHHEFEGRAIFGSNFIPSENGNVGTHGTGVASVVAGFLNGVARKSYVVDVKVLKADGNGSTGDTLHGYDWTVNDIVRNGRQNIAVINLSFGAGHSKIWDQAIQNAYNEGILTVVAAGNGGDNVSNWSPAAAPEALTVAAHDKNNDRVSFSNYGPGVDVFAPGKDISIAHSSSDDAVGYLSGTSFSAPHVAGLVCYLRALEGTLAAAEAKDRILELASAGLVKDVKGSANLVAYNGNGM